MHVRFCSATLEAQEFGFFAPLFNILFCPALPFVRTGGCKPLEGGDFPFVETWSPTLLFELGGNVGFPVLEMGFSLGWELSIVLTSRSEVEDFGVGSVLSGSVFDLFMVLLASCYEVVVY